MRVTIRSRTVLALAVLATCGAGLAASADTAQARFQRGCLGACPGGPDFCGAVHGPDGEPIICYRTRP